MKENSFTIKTMKFVTNLYDKNDFTHGWPHILAVRKNALKLQRILGGDKEIIEIAAYLHDCDYSKGIKSHAETSAKKAIEFLNSINYNKTEQVVEAILNHAAHSHKLDASLEAKILFDADKMETIKPYGILRVIIYQKDLPFKKIMKKVQYYCVDIYKELYFNESRKMIKKDYEKTKRIVEWLNEKI
jgi:HD superfamily phosphodiesterase